MDCWRHSLILVIINYLIISLTPHFCSGGWCLYVRLWLVDNMDQLSSWDLFSETSGPGYSVYIPVCILDQAVKIVKTKSRMQVLTTFPRSWLLYKTKLSKKKSYGFVFLSRSESASFIYKTTGTPSIFMSSALLVTDSRVSNTTSLTELIC